MLRCSMFFSPMIFYDVPSFSMAYQAIPARSATARCKISLSNKLLDNVTRNPLYFMGKTMVYSRLSLQPIQ